MKWLRGQHEIERDAAIQGHSRSFVVVPTDAAYLPTSNFLTVIEISPSLHIYAPPLFQVELEKDGWV